MESKDKWFQRMMKTFCIFCQLIIQDEQNPFDIQDGWQWLANFSNSVARLD